MQSGYRVVHRLTSLQTINLKLSQTSPIPSPACLQLPLLTLSLSVSPFYSPSLLSALNLLSSHTLFLFYICQVQSFFNIAKRGRSQLGSHGWGVHKEAAAVCNWPHNIVMGHVDNVLLLLLLSLPTVSYCEKNFNWLTVGKPTRSPDCITLFQVNDTMLHIM